MIEFSFMIINNENNAIYCKICVYFSCLDGYRYLDNKYDYVDNIQQQRLKRLIHLSIKSSILCFIAGVANWFFIFVGLIFIFNLGWFINLDCLINGLCIYLVFSFNDRLYRVLCYPFIYCWNCCFSKLNTGIMSYADLTQLTQYGSL